MGDGNPISFTPVGIAGVYTVTAENTVTSCSISMAGDATIIVDPVSGDPAFFGNETWIGYVYDESDNGSLPGGVSFAASDYRGFVIESEIDAINAQSSYDTNTDIFDLNLGGGSIAGVNLCGTYDNNFSVRYRMTKNFTPGQYTFTIGSDDGVRFYINGNLIIDQFINRAYDTNSEIACLNGQHDLTIEYYENGGQSRLTFDYTLDSATPTVSLIVDQNPICLGDEAVFNATPVNAGISPSYQWFINGALVAGETADEFRTSGLSDGDEVFVQLFPAGPTCFSGPVSSNIITIAVSTDLPASVSITADQNPVCSGDDVTFTAMPTNGGLNPTFQWRVNGVDAVGETGLTFTSNGLSDLDDVDVVMTADPTASCITGSPAFSNSIEINVLDSTDPICSGGGDCATVVITPMPSSATCTNSDGSIFFDINPPVPVINNTGVTISIIGPASRTNFNDPNFAGLPIGTYNFTIEYGDPSCIKTGSVTIDQSGTVGTPIVSDIIEPECFGDATGAVTIDVTGETGNVFQWSLDGINFEDFLVGSQISGIPAGPAPTFEQVISIRRDATDPCNAAAIVVINNANPEITADISSTDASCDNNDGSITISNVSGGSGSYSFIFDGTPLAALPSGGLFDNLNADTYNFSIIDEGVSGCQQDFSIVVGFPGQVQAVVSSNPPSCDDPGVDNGEVLGTILTTGSFQVGISDDRDVAPTEFITVVNAGGAESFAFFELVVGTYFVTIQPEGAACPTIEEVSITGGPIPVRFDDIRLECLNNNTSERAIIIDGLQGDYSTTFSLDLIAANNDVETFAIDANQITMRGIVENAGAILNVSNNYDVVVRQSQAICTEDIQFSFANFVVPESFVGVNIDTLSNSLPNRPSGALVINDFNGGLEPFTTSIELFDPINPSQSFSSEDLVGRNNAGQLEQIYEDLPAGVYDIIVTDSLGCSPQTYTIGIPLNTDVIIPNVFTPNGDGTNETFEIINIPGSGNGTEMLITNRWGKVVFESEDYYFNSEGDNSFWDGGDEPEGVYFYTVEIEGDTFKGWVEIIRGQP